MTTVPAHGLAPLAERRAALEARHPVWVPHTLHEALDAAAPVPLTPLVTRAGPADLPRRRNTMAKIAAQIAHSSC